MHHNRLVPLENRADWEAALDGLPHSFWHGWSAHHAISSGTGRNAYLFVHEDTVTGGRAACPFVERDWQGTTDIYTGSGFAGFTCAGKCPGARDAWNDMVRQRGYVCGYFALHPKTGCAELHMGVRPAHSLYTVDLADGAQAAVARSSRSVRRSLADWQELGSPYSEDRQQVKEFLLRHYSDFMDRVGARASGRWPARTLASMLDDARIVMVGASDEQGICAAHTFAVGWPGADTHLNVSVREGRSFTTALLVWGMHRLAEGGCRWLHLGGGMSPGDHVAQSKQKYRPEVDVLPVACEVYDREVFDRLCLQMPARSQGASGFFPPYRDALSV